MQGYTLKLMDNKVRDFIILSCASKEFFSPYLKRENTNPILWTKGLMAPEAYTLEEVFEGWINSESKSEIHLRASKAYHKYQKCSLNAAKNLFDNQW